MMLKKIKELRIWLVIVAFLTTVGILFGGQSMAVRFRAENPARREIATIKAVRRFSVRTGPTGLLVELKLDKVDNLETILNFVRQKVEFYYNQPVSHFKITSHPIPKLARARYDLSFYLEEALASGRYIQLKQALDEYKDIKAKVYLARDFIYIQLESGSAYLYEAIPRRSKIPTANNNQGGEST